MATGEQFMHAKAKKPHEKWGKTTNKLAYGCAKVVGLFF